MSDAPSNRAVMIVLAYLWPLAIIPLLLEKEDSDVRWHAKHGIVLMVAEVVIFAAIGTITSLTLGLTTLLLGCSLSILAIILWVLVIAIHGIAIVKGLNGSRLMVPWLSRWADRWAT